PVSVCLALRWRSFSVKSLSVLCSGSAFTAVPSSLWGRSGLEDLTERPAYLAAKPFREAEEKDGCRFGSFESRQARRSRILRCGVFGSMVRQFAMRLGVRALS